MTLKHLPPEESIILDAPYIFGIECNWLTIPTVDTESLAEFLKLDNLVPCNWKHGVIWGHHLKVYVSPPVDGWTFVVSNSLPYVNFEPGLTNAKQLVIELSQEYGQAQYFGSLDSGAEYDHWIKAENGQILRAYCYAEGENFIVDGEPTRVEKKYNLVNTLSEEAKNDADYLFREDIDFPRTIITLEVAGAWGFSPQDLPKKMAPRLGLLGERKW